MRSLVVAITVGLLAGCGHTNGFYNDRTMPTPNEQEAACAACGGSGNALEISVAAVLLAGIVVAKLSR